MNNIQLRVRLDSINESYTHDGKLQISGICSFKFYDKNELKVRPLYFITYGQNAVTLNQTGVNTIHLVSGRLNIYKPSEQNPNHQPVLTIDRCLCLENSVEPNKSPTPTNYVSQTVAKNIPNHNNGHKLSLENVPF